MPKAVCLPAEIWSNKVICIEGRLPFNFGHQTNVKVFTRWRDPIGSMFMTWGSSSTELWTIPGWFRFTDSVYHGVHHRKISVAKRAQIENHRWPKARTSSESFACNTSTHVLSPVNFPTIALKPLPWSTRIRKLLKDFWSFVFEKSSLDHDLGENFGKNWNVAQTFVFTRRPYLHVNREILLKKKLNECAKARAVHARTCNTCSTLQKP